MSKNPWTDPDPQPGDFDADLAAIDPRCVDAHASQPLGGALPASLGGTYDLAGELAQLDAQAGDISDENVRRALDEL